MKTKVMSALLAITLLGSLTACGNALPSGESGSKPAAGNDASESSSVSEAPVQPEEEMAPFTGSATLEETVLVDEGGVKITATGLTYTAYSVDLDLTIENNSGKDLTFISGSLGYGCNSVNGYMMDGGYLNCDVANGKMANDSISFSHDDLLLCGIREIADMEIAIQMTDDEYNNTYSGPRSLRTSAAETYDYGTDSYSQTITSQAAMNTYGYEMMQFEEAASYDQNGLRLLSSAVVRNRNGEIALLLELENTTDSTVYVATSDIRINGLVVNSSLWSSDAINPGKRRIVEIALSSVLDSSCWDAYGISEPGTISLSIAQYNEQGALLTQETPVEIVVPDMQTGFDAEGTEVYNKNGLRIVAKTVQEGASDYSNDLYLLLLAENNSGKTISINDDYGSLSVNGVMTDYSFYGQELANGEAAALVIRLWETSLEENQITSAADVQEIEMSFDIREGYTTIDEPVVTIAPNG